MARINVEQQALTDSRFAVLGKHLDPTSRSPALYGLGFMVHLWNQCQERGVYSLAPAAIDATGITLGFAPDGGCSQAIVLSELGEWDGEYVRIRGTKGRIEWLNLRRKDGSRGGRPRTVGLRSTYNPRDIPSDNPPAPAPAPVVQQLHSVKRKPLDPRWLPWFHSQFWPRYPRKVQKGAALKAWESMCPKNGTDPKQLCSAILSLLEARKAVEWAGRPGNGTNYPHAATFLHKESFTEGDLRDAGVEDE